MARQIYFHFIRNIVKLLHPFHMLGIFFRTVKVEFYLAPFLLLHSYFFFCIIFDRSLSFQNILFTILFPNSFDLISLSFIQLYPFYFAGVLIYEMLAGYPPFYDDNPFGIYEKILSGKIEWPRHLDPVAKDIIKKLLVQDRTKRLGNMKVNMGQFVGTVI